MIVYGFEGKKVEITCITEPHVSGTCVGYTSALDNEPEIASIEVENNSGQRIVVYENEIVSIKEI